MKGQKEQKNNSDNNHLYLKILIKIYCFQEMITQNLNLKNDSDIYIGDIILIKKNEMEIFKKCFHYKNLCEEIGKKKIDILNGVKDKNNIIDYYKLNDSILLNIITNLSPNIVKKIDNNNNKNELISKLKEENNKDEVIKYIKYEKPKKCKIPLLDSFEIINMDILNLIQNQIPNFNIIFGNCILGQKYLFISAKYI